MRIKTFQAAERFFFIGNFRFGKVILSGTQAKLQPFTLMKVFCGIFYKLHPDK